MKHRHLTYVPGRAVEDLPAAAILDILDRGDLVDWQPIAAAVEREPDGPFAERVAHLIEVHPMYGTTALWRTWIQHLRQRRNRTEAPDERASLASLRRGAGLTQAQLAARVGMSQSDLSKFERRDDIRVSTLRSYIEGLGGTLHLVAHIGSSTDEFCVGSRKGHYESIAEARKTPES